MTHISGVCEGECGLLCIGWCVFVISAISVWGRLKQDVRSWNYMSLYEILLHSSRMQG